MCVSYSSIKYNKKSEQLVIDIKEEKQKKMRMIMFLDTQLTFGNVREN